MASCSILRACSLISTRPRYPGAYTFCASFLNAAYSPKCVEGEFCEVELPLYGVLGSSGLLGQEVGQLLPTHQACLPEEPSSSASAPPPRPRNCTLSATTSTLLLLDPSWASQVRYCNLPSTKMGSPFFL